MEPAYIKFNGKHGTNEIGVVDDEVWFYIACHGCTFATDDRAALGRLSDALTDWLDEHEEEATDAE